MCSTFTAALLAGLARRRAHISLKGSLARWAPLVRVGAAVGLAGLLTLAYGRIDQLMVYGLAPHRADAGLYAGIYRILDTAGFVPGVVWLGPAIEARFGVGALL